MRTLLLFLSLAAAPIFIDASVSAQQFRTQAPCSPVVDHTQGNVTVTFSGGCTVGVTPVELKEIIDSVLAQRAIPAELLDRYGALSRQFGVTDAALTTFFRVLKERKVTTEDLDAKLREIASRHLTLLKQTEPLGDDDPEVAAIKKAAVAAIAAGNYARAEELLQHAFDTDLANARRAQDAADKRFVTAAKTRADLGQLKLTELRYAAAVEDFQAAANLVPASEKLARSTYLDSLGAAAFEAYNYSLAASALSEVLNLREQLFGSDALTVAAAHNNLAGISLAQGRLGEAETRFKRAMAIHEKVLGPEHPDVAPFLNNVAELYRAQGRYVEAEPIFKRAISVYENAPGTEHPELAAYLNNLAELYRAQRRYAEAEPLYARALAIGEGTLGKEHPLVATYVNNKGLLYRALGRYEEAETLYKRALAIDEKVLGSQDPAVALRLNNLAVLYHSERRFAEAELLLRRALAIDEKVLGPNHPTVANRLENLAAVCDELGRSTEGEMLRQRALVIKMLRH